MYTWGGGGGRLNVDGGGSLSTSARGIRFDVVPLSPATSVFPFVMCDSSTIDERVQQLVAALGHVPTWALASGSAAALLLTIHDRSTRLPQVTRLPTAWPQSSTRDVLLTAARYESTKVTTWQILRDASCDPIGS